MSHALLVNVPPPKQQIKERINKWNSVAPTSEGALENVYDGHTIGGSSLFEVYPRFGGCLMGNLACVALMLETILVQQVHFFCVADSFFDLHCYYELSVLDFLGEDLGANGPWSLGYGFPYGSSTNGAVGATALLNDFILKALFWKWRNISLAMYGSSLSDCDQSRSGKGSC